MGPDGGGSDRPGVRLVGLDALVGRLDGHRGRPDGTDGADGGSPPARAIGVDELTAARSTRSARAAPPGSAPPDPVRTGDGPTLRTEQPVLEQVVPQRSPAREQRAAPAPPAPQPPGGPGSTSAAPARPARRRGSPRPLDPDADPVAAAREICLRLLTDRARTRHELTTELRRRGVPDEASNRVLERFDEVGLIDDAAFAGQWVRSRHGFRGLGRRAIAVELRRKGVADEVADEALEQIDGEAEIRRARALVDRRMRSLRIGTPDERTAAARRLVGMLARKGYPAGTAFRVVREALAATGADSAELDGAEPDSAEPDGAEELST